MYLSVCLCAVCLCGCATAACREIAGLGRWGSDMRWRRGVCGGAGAEEDLMFF